MHLLFAALLLRHWLLASDLHVEPGRHGGVPSYYGTDTNWALFDSTVAAMRRADPDARVVVLSGDFLRHHFPHSPALAEQTMARIVRSFDAAFPRAQFVIVPGNNDDPCGDYRATPGSPYFRYIARLWEPLVNRNGAAPDFEHDFGQFGWYSARLPIGNERLIALDTVYWSIVYRSCGNFHPEAPQRQLRWFERSVQALPRGVRALVVMHIPPGVDAHSTLITHRFLVVPFWRPGIASAFSRALSRDRDRIAFAVAGHVHRDSFRLFGGVPILVAPSISPVYANNPAFLRLDVASDGSLQDYTPFVYDEAAGAWQRASSFDRTYGVREFSGPALASIHERLYRDRALRARWAAMFMSGSGNREITSATWPMYRCAQTELSGGFVACAGLQRRVGAVFIAGGIGVAVVLGALALWAVRLGRGRRAA